VNSLYPEVLVNNDTLKEAEIIKKCKQGDQQGFKALVESYAPRLMGICLRYMKDETTAKDVLQESFIRIFQNIGKYKKTGSFEAWLSRITVTSALMELRKKRKLPFHVELEQNHVEELKENVTAEMTLNKEDILEMIHELPDHYRLIFNLYVIEGYTHGEIATLLEIGESTSRTKLTRARQKMQEIYQRRSELKKRTKIEDRKEISRIS
jgi:RNA polymerase sigma factor (sigma-70 family)